MIERPGALAEGESRANRFADKSASPKNASCSDEPCAKPMEIAAAHGKVARAKFRTGPARVKARPVLEWVPRRCRNQVPLRIRITNGTIRPSRDCTSRASNSLKGRSSRMTNPASKWHHLATSNVMFCLFPLLLAVVLYTLYQDPTFNEKPDKYFTAVLTFATIAGGWLSIRGASGILDLLVRPVQRSPFHALLIVAVVALVVFMLFAKFVLDAFPNSGDEVSYVLQAQTYARGRLWVAPPPVAEAFRLFWFLDKDGKWVGVFRSGMADGHGAVFSSRTALVDCESADWCG